MYKVFFFFLLLLLLCLFADSLTVRNAFVNRCCCCLFFKFLFLPFHLLTLTVSAKRVCRNQMIYLHLCIFLCANFFPSFLCNCWSHSAKHYMCTLQSSPFVTYLLLACHNQVQIYHFTFMTHLPTYVCVCVWGFFLLAFVSNIVYQPFVISFTLTIIIWIGSLSTFKQHTHSYLIYWRSFVCFYKE